MSLVQAFLIGWSLSWRQAVGVLILLACLFVAFQLGLRSRTALVGIFLSGFFLVILPWAVRQLPEIDYTGFRLVVARTAEGPSGLTYAEGLLLATATELASGLCSGAAAALTLVFLRTLLPREFIPPITLAALLVPIPLKAALLISVPIRRFRLQPVDDFESRN
jgi:hypothetical protein